jgi:hypothetical protein
MDGILDAAPICERVAVVVNGMYGGEGTVLGDCCLLVGTGCSSVVLGILFVNSRVFS